MSSLNLNPIPSQNNCEWIEYCIFPPPNRNSDKDKDSLLLNLNASAQSLSQDYIWHNEGFHLSPWTLDDEDKDSPCFHGRTVFADNSEDEWFIVYLLRELSKVFPEVVIRVEDTDGEFLLIEAAEVLPDWAESDETCKNRLYIHQGQYHLIPPELHPLNSPLKIQEGVHILLKNKEETLLPHQIQTTINSRIGNYPDKINDNLYHANVYLPPVLGKVLKEKPGIVGAGVTMFCLRDPLALKRARLLKNFGNQGVVKTRVKFTKCLYAMLMKDEYRDRDRVDVKSFGNGKGKEDFKAYDLGVKLTTGFEILLNEYHPHSHSKEPKDFNTDQRWLRYKETLKRTGYFKDLMEGSKPYQDLVESAKTYFESNMHGVYREGYSWLENASGEIRRIIDSLGKMEVDFEGESESLPPDDDDSFLSITPDDLESLLQAKFSSGLNPEEIPKKLKQFMNQVSDYSGVECDDKSSSGTNSPRENTNGLGGDDFTEPVDFRADEFVGMVDKLLNDLGAPDKDWNSDNDSYGEEEEDLLDFDKKTNTDLSILMNQMDRELASTKIGQTFKSIPSCSSNKKMNKATMDEVEEFDEEEMTPVDIDMDMLANMMESLRSQEGGSGPGGNLLMSFASGGGGVGDGKRKRGK